MLHQRQLLVNNSDAFTFGIANVRGLEHLAGKDDFALVAAVRIDPAQHFHQRGFSRAIFAAQRHHFAGIQPQAYVIDCFHRPEGFGDAFHFK